MAWALKQREEKKLHKAANMKSDMPSEFPNTPVWKGFFYYCTRLTPFCFLCKNAAFLMLQNTTASVMVHTMAGTDSEPRLLTLLNLLKAVWGT